MTVFGRVLRRILKPFYRRSSLGTLPQWTIGPRYCSYTVSLGEENLFGVPQSIIFDRRNAVQISLASVKTDLGRQFSIAAQTQPFTYVAERCEVLSHKSSNTSEYSISVVVHRSRGNKYYERICPVDIITSTRNTVIKAQFTVSQISEAKLFLRPSQWDATESRSCSTLTHRSSFISLYTSSVSIALPNSGVSSSCCSLCEDDLTKTVTAVDPYSACRDGAETYVITGPGLSGNFNNMDTTFESSRYREGAQTFTLNVRELSGNVYNIDAELTTSAETCSLTNCSELEGVAALYEQVSPADFCGDDRVKPCAECAGDQLEQQPEAINHGSSPTENKGLSHPVESNRGSSSYGIRPTRSVFTPPLSSAASGDFGMNSGGDWPVSFVESTRAIAVACGDHPSNTTISSQCTLSSPEPRSRRRRRLRRLLTNLLSCCILPNEIDSCD